MTVILPAVLLNIFGFQEINFSKLEWHHLKSLGIVRKCLYISFDRLAASFEDMAQNTKDEISILKNQLDKVYTQVHIQVSCVISIIKLL
jgi:hypothetical protein